MGTLSSRTLDDATILLSDVQEQNAGRILTGPWDRNFGDPPGVPCDAVVLIGGEPGAGKSTVALQWCDALAQGSGKEVLYLSAEESSPQIKARAVRLGLRELASVRLVPLEKVGDISLTELFERRTFGGVVIDSVTRFAQDMDDAVEIVNAFKFFAVTHKMPFIVINQVNKEGELAGKKELEHVVDISLMLSKGERGEVEEAIDAKTGAARAVLEPRELYTEKSRYGPSGISTFYAMTEKGLVPIDFKDDDEDDE